MPVQKEGSSEDTDAQGAAFGPWMIAKRTSRSGSRRPAPAAAHPRSGGWRDNGTRFSALSNMEVDENAEIPFSGTVFTEIPAPIQNSSPLPLRGNIPANNGPIIAPASGPTVSIQHAGNQSQMIADQVKGADLVASNITGETVVPGPTVTASRVAMDPTSNVEGGNSPQAGDAYHFSKHVEVNNNPKWPSQQEKTGQSSLKNF